ncbi:MAG: cytochrome o ubiquinol oxidase subunit III [Acinetobacter populi]|jgi:cytochrome o ubiquinol oxidase subunit 3|uniref:cytochrome o ubiquinol oxidase subunit III n=1 Tax=Acinetobacter populi TaxID=1582270 RepID=UPI0023525415|nr:cytochrome o ubiquinol oxidase subunit III [Acinetobacter populi]MCH4248040.1 cytochrome o ubiquinol oxidase subunit III [Acinetobacter populi]
MAEVLHHDDHGHDDHHHHDDTPITVFGFWTYLMSDLVLFGTLFIAFAVLSGHVPPGTPTAKELFGDSLGFVLTETMALLISSVTFGFAVLARYKNDVSGVLKWLIITFVFGAAFIGMEFYEFHHLVHSGHGPSTSAFLSAFFTLVGTHGIHVTSGLVWMLVLMYQIKTQGLTLPNTRRLACLSLFWHFLDIVWICVFSLVYLKGVLA